MCVPSLFIGSIFRNNSTSRPGAHKQTPLISKHSEGLQTRVTSEVTENRKTQLIKNIKNKAQTSLSIQTLSTCTISISAVCRASKSRFLRLLLPCAIYSILLQSKSFTTVKPLRNKVARRLQGSELQQKNRQLSIVATDRQRLSWIMAALNAHRTYSVCRSCVMTRVAFFLYIAIKQHSHSLRTADWNMVCVCVCLLYIM